MKSVSNGCSKFGQSNTEFASHLRHLTTMPFIMRYLLICVLCLSLLPQLHSDEVHLSDGRILSGKILENPENGKLKFKVIVGSMSMVMNIDRKDIVKLTTGMTAEEKALAAVEKKRKDLGSKATAADVWALALELKDLKQSLLVKQYARDTIAIDPNHREANLALGRVEFNGTWMTERQMHLAKGEVYFEGKWLSQANVDKIVAEREENRIALAERRAERAEARRERRDREKAEAYSSMQQQPLINYGGVRLYHLCPTNVGLPVGGHSYRSSSRSSGFSFNASGGSGSSSWSFGINR